MKILILGTGNTLMGDDGVGVHVVQQLQQRYDFPSEVRLLAGGVLGLDLLSYLQGITHLLVVDAVDAGKAPGAFTRLTGDEIPPTFTKLLSPHQMGLQDLLDVNILQGKSPPSVVLWGIQPASLDISLGLSPSVASRIELMEYLILAELEEWGVTAMPQADVV
ncbi:HyaD/HybD family hydrogenase maturation endopeptidase [Geobacter sp. DSM 9736]|uniref:HyaD/HybD family hydrogenase maturation endopeptidase n=1 Tax=Geobacter sp. DSM 9736 TaxID=1277350 RepID=UPI000B4FD7B2|nr:HyaD/HybD family hydrogenase maturation endopeptidase [Geobacter sp. DSM 9736]SNB47611.1 hydrogenase maturation protease [Geobacter sp. DSM 9736]